MTRNAIGFLIYVVGAFFSAVVLADDKAVFHRTIALDAADHMILDLAVSKADVTISYYHSGEVVRGGAAFSDTSISGFLPGQSRRKVHAKAKA
jgi:hypothetical protein